MPHRVSVFRVFLCLSLSLAVCLMLGGCFLGKQVRVTSEPEFNLMARRIGPILRDCGILDEQGAYWQPLFGAADLPEHLGEVLFRRLSPAFRFQLDPSLLPPTFAASRAAGGTVRLLPEGFILSQGQEEVRVQLLAETDWNDDKQPDWLLLCRVKTERVEVSGIVRGQGLRDYYLLVEDTAAPVLQPRLLAVYDCLKNRCQLFIVPSRQAGDRKSVFEPEAPVVDVEPGEGEITLPPAKAPLPQDAVREQKLAG